jgi:hypothetical protein
MRVTMPAWAPIFLLVLALEARLCVPFRAVDVPTHGCYAPQPCAPDGGAVLVLRGGGLGDGGNAGPSTEAGGSRGAAKRAARKGKLQAGAQRARRGSEQDNADAAEHRRRTVVKDRVAVLRPEHLRPNQRAAVPANPQPQHPGAALPTQPPPLTSPSRPPHVPAPRPPPWQEELERLTQRDWDGEEQEARDALASGA